jgi:hypothetical protein
MALSDKTTRSRNRTLFITEETTNGTPVYPSGTDAFLAAEIDGFTQDTETAEAQEYTDALFTQAEQVVGYAYANPTMTIHPRFGASAGNTPVESILLKNFFGNQTVVGSTSVTYDFLDHDNTLSAYYQYADVLQCVASGIVISEMNFSVSKQELMAYEFTGISNKVEHSSQFEVPSGTSTITAGSGVTIPVGTTASYVAQVGTKFDVFNTSGTKTETITVLTVSSTNITADTTVDIDAGFIMKPSLPAGSYSSVQPFAPTSATVYVGPTGTAMASLIHADYALKARELSVSMNKNMQTPTADELNGSLFGGPDYEIDVPSVEISTTVNLRPSTGRYYEQARTDQLRSIAVTIPHGGQELVVYVPSVFMEVSDGGENAGAAQQTLDFRIQKGSASSSADVFKLIYR